ncbi:hypothetical protein J2S46_000508 [Kitasatospora herbaricolor]|nr:hypothetical protein [Kitasatospora herbaricolor]
MRPPCRERARPRVRARDGRRRATPAALLWPVRAGPDQWGLRPGPRREAVPRPAASDRRRPGGARRSASAAASSGSPAARQGGDRGDTPRVGVRPGRGLASRPHRALRS